MGYDLFPTFQEDAFKSFLAKLTHQVTATLDCFDRVLFKGHLRAISFPEGLEHLMAQRGLKLKDFKRFAQTHSDQLILRAKTVAAKLGRPSRYLPRHIRQDEEARRLAAERQITKGLVCIFSELELCPAFKLAWGEGRPRIAFPRRKCLCLYYYFLHPDLGWIHLRLQTWFPFVVQIAVNGHEWLGRNMKQRHMPFEQLDNAFLKIAQPTKAQRLADTFCQQDWPRLLESLARFVNPLLGLRLRPHGYYWTVDQAESATDLLFESRAALGPLFRELVQHALLCFRARDVLGFLGKKLRGNFQSEVIHDFKTRVEGMRVKHRVGKNWIKMYDKFGCVLRIETVINNPDGFLIRREGIRKGQRVIGWFGMTKGVTGLYRYAPVARSANHRYLEALAVVHDPAPARELMRRCTQRVERGERTYRGFNPAAEEDIAVCKAVLDGQHCLHGLSNRQIRGMLQPSARPEAATQRRLSARTTRWLGRRHVRGLIAKVSHARRWRVTRDGAAFLSLAIRHHEEAYGKTLVEHAA